MLLTFLRINGAFICNERQIDPASQINGKRKAREGSEKKHGSTDRIR